MIYGFLIGVLIASLLTVASNWKGEHKASVIARFIGLNVLVIDFCTLIGLLIRGA